MTTGTFDGLSNEIVYEPLEIVGSIADHRDVGASLCELFEVFLLPQALAHENHLLSRNGSLLSSMATFPWNRARRCLAANFRLRGSHTESLPMGRTSLWESL